MSGYFITSCGTDIGKTYCTVQMIQSLLKMGQKVKALKPVISGFDPGDWAHSDAGQLLKASKLALTDENLHHISPWRYRAPLAPSIAAALENRSLSLDEVAAFCQRHIRDDTITLVEGVGGIMAPMTPHQTVRDWVSFLHWPVILVVGSYLGSLSHTLTAIEALNAVKIPVAMGLITAGPTATIDPKQTKVALKGCAPGISWSIVPEGKGLDTDILMRMIETHHSLNR